MWKRAYIYILPHINDNDETNNNFNNNTLVPLVFFVIVVILFVCLFVFSVLEDFLHAVNIMDCGLVKSGS